MNLGDLYRANDVKRWQIVKTLRSQSVAEHSWSVAMIAWRICDELGCEAKVVTEVIQWALVHDVAEVLTGDIATPVKVYLKKDGCGDAFAKLEEKITDCINVGNAPSEQVHRIVKLADILEAVAFLNDNGIGIHAGEVRHRLEEKLTELAQKWEMYGAVIATKTSLLFDLPTHIDDMVKEEGR